MSTSEHTGRLHLKRKLCNDNDEIRPSKLKCQANTRACESETECDPKGDAQFLAAKKQREILGSGSRAWYEALGRYEEAQSAFDVATKVYEETKAIRSAAKRACREAGALLEAAKARFCEEDLVAHQARVEWNSADQEPGDAARDRGPNVSQINGNSDLPEAGVNIPTIKASSSNMETRKTPRISQAVGKVAWFPPNSLRAAMQRVTQISYRLDTWEEGDAATAADLITEFKASKKRLRQKLRGSLNEIEVKLRVREDGKALLADVTQCIGRNKHKPAIAEALKMMRHTRNEKSRAKRQKRKGTHKLRQKRLKPGDEGTVTFGPVTIPYPSAIRYTDMSKSKRDTFHKRVMWDEDREFMDAGMSAYIPAKRRAKMQNTWNDIGSMSSFSLDMGKFSDSAAFWGSCRL